MGKMGLQREMDSFLRETENEQFNIRRITKSGFSRSRRKLAPEASFTVDGNAEVDRAVLVGFPSFRFAEIEGVRELMFHFRKNFALTNRVIRHQKFLICVESCVGAGFRKLGAPQCLEKRSAPKKCTR
jgi:hypothetical protein